MSKPVSKAPSEVGSTASSAIAKRSTVSSTTKNKQQQEQEQQQQQQQQEERASNAPTTTTVLAGKLDKLTHELEKERQARLLAQQELKKTCAELEALETVLHLRGPAEKKRTYEKNLTS